MYPVYFSTFLCTAVVSWMATGIPRQAISGVNFGFPLVFVKSFDVPLCRFVWRFCVHILKGMLTFLFMFCRFDSKRVIFGAA